MLYVFYTIIYIRLLDILDYTIYHMYTILVYIPVEVLYYYIHINIYIYIWRVQIQKKEFATISLNWHIQWIWDIKGTQIDTCLRYITVLQLNIYFAFGSQITIDLKIVANSFFWIWTLHIYYIYYTLYM